MAIQGELFLTAYSMDILTKASLQSSVEKVLYCQDSTSDGTAPHLNLPYAKGMQVFLGRGAGFLRCVGPALQ